MLDEGSYVTGAGEDAQTLIAMGVLLELVLIIANVGTAVVPFSIHRRVSEPGAVAYVTARVVECMFIAFGIVSLLAISTLRQDAPSGTVPPWARDSKPSTNGRSVLGRGSSSASGTV